MHMKYTPTNSSISENDDVYECQFGYNNDDLGSLKLDANKFDWDKAMNNTSHDD